MGSKNKAPKVQPIPKAVAPVTPEDEDVKGATDDERRKIAAMQGRSKTVTSRQNAQGLKTVFG